MSGFSYIRVDERESVAALAYRRLQQMIVTLDLAPGNVASEKELAQRLGLGRTPVREAVQRLCWEGLVEIRPRAGIQVAPLEPGDWARVVTARRGPEVAMARNAARLLTQDAAARFHATALSMQKAVVTGNLRAFLLADEEFDNALASASENRFAARAVAPLQVHSRRFWYRYQSDAGLAGAAERHLWVIRGILEGAADEAGVAMERLMDLLAAHAREAIG